MTDQQISQVEHNNPVKFGKGRPAGKRRSAGLRKLELARLIVQTQEHFAESIKTNKKLSASEIITMLEWLARNP